MNKRGKCFVKAHWRKLPREATPSWIAFDALSKVFLTSRQGWVSSPANAGAFLRRDLTARFGKDGVREVRYQLFKLW